MHSCISDIEKGKAFLRLLHVLILRDFGMNNLGIIVQYMMVTGSQADICTLKTPLGTTLGMCYYPANTGVKQTLIVNITRYIIKVHVTFYRQPPFWTKFGCALA